MTSAKRCLLFLFFVLFSNSNLVIQFSNVVFFNIYFDIKVIGKNSTNRQVISQAGTYISIIEE